MTAEAVAAPARFDVRGPLPPPGVTVLEASAGTGKTFTIAALVARFVAEGKPLSGLLAVTFTRMATGELRDRVRARLVSAEEGLRRCIELGEPAPGGDEVLGLLADGRAEQLQARRERLAAALASFDEATITTTHGFCQLMLAGLGVAGDLASGASLLEDPSDLIEEVVDDLYVRWALQKSAPAPFSRSEALVIARKAVANRETALEPPPDSSPAGLRRRLADGVRTEVARRLLDANLLTYDDVLIRLKETLTDELRGPAASKRLRDRYSVVLVDEFQDTDPTQWEVVNTAFGNGTTVLVLIGDPKQAIYAFRGADVFAYLEAATTAGARFSLETNWRSDEGLLEALDALLDPLQLGNVDIPYRRVVAAPSHRPPGLRGAPVEAELRVRVVRLKGLGLPRTSYDDLRTPAATRFVANDVASDIVRLLGSGAKVVEFADDGTEQQSRLITPGEVAVLVRTNYQATVVQQALRAVGVPAVVAGSESVLATTTARDWLRLLEALEQPASRSRAVAVALTPFIGMSAGEVATADEATWEVVHARLHSWEETLRRRGIATLFRSVVASQAIPGRLLAQPDGERVLTDLAHIAELLHAEASRGQLAPPALRAWLARRVDESALDGTEAENRSRRLDSDAEAVQVLTIHRAKGLEFAVVYCPFLWAPGQDLSVGDPVIFHDPAEANERKLDVAGDREGRDYLRHFELQKEEERGEDLRELYVALTRARHQVVLWWARVYHSGNSPLGRLLLCRDAKGNVETSGRQPSDEEVLAKLGEIAGRCPGRISVEVADQPSDEQWEGGRTASGATLDVAPFNRSLDVRWRRASYSAITAALHGDVIGSEPEDPGTGDEPVAAETAAVSVSLSRGERAEATEEERLRAVPSPLVGLPGGVEAGTFVHRLLECADFAAPSLEEELGQVVASERGRFEALASAEDLVPGLVAALSTPLGQLAFGLRLRDVARSDRLDELGFELPVAGGDGPGADLVVSTGDIAAVFSEHEAGGPLAGYGARLSEPLLQTELRGYLTGSLDLVFRLRPEGDLTRYFVVDYKTNWLAPLEEALSAWHYRPSALSSEMRRMHYPLQAVFYVVALHRYLRWRLPDYSPDDHLGGVLYLFVRGMTGKDVPLVDGQPCGVFSWRPPTALVTGLSDLLETGRTRPRGSRRP